MTISSARRVYRDNRLPHHRDKDLELKTVIHQWSNWVELLSYMRLFVEVARTKSFRRAADALDMPNSTLSRHIAELEKTIGLRLLHRSTRKVELTEAGEVYFKRCQSIVEEARIAHESLLDVVERPTGTLRVSMPADLATDHLAPIIADFAKTYPLVAFEFDLRRARWICRQSPSISRSASVRRPWRR